MTAPRTAQLQLILGITSYSISSLGGIAIVKYLNYHYNLKAWVLFALLSRSTWVFSILLHGFLQHVENIQLGLPTLRQIRIYAAIAVGLSLVELLNSMSMSVLPGSWYALFKGSDVGWSMLLSFLVLDKKYNGVQILAAILIMAGIGLVFILGSNTSKDEAMTSSSDVVSFSVAATMCLGGAFLNALCSVLTERILKQTLKEEEEKLLSQTKLQQAPSKLLLSNAYSMWTSIFCFVLLFVPLVLSGQLEQVRRSVHDLASNSDSNNNSTTPSIIDSMTVAHAKWTTTKQLLAISIFLALLGISRFAERLSKHWICVAASAVTFSLVQAARRLSGVFVLALLFHEDFPTCMLIGSHCCAIGFALHYYWTPSKEQNAEEQLAGSENKNSNNHKNQYELVSQSTLQLEDFSEEQPKCNKGNAV